MERREDGRRVEEKGEEVGLMKESKDKKDELMVALVGDHPARQDFEA